KSGTRANAAAAAAAACIEPACNLTYQGGRVQHTPKVYLVFWGPEWASNPTDQAAETYLVSFFTGLGASPETWSAVTSQFGAGSGTQTFCAAGLAGCVKDTTLVRSPPLASGVVGTEASKAQTHFAITDTDNAQAVIVTQSGTCYKDETSVGLGLFAG